jgi:hypothetical protein
MGWEESEWNGTGTVSALERLYGVMNYELDPIRHMLLDLDQPPLCGRVIHKI